MATDLKRYRFSVPPEDADVIQWLANQRQISMSLRVLIRREIERGGMRDIFASGAEPRARRGRPPATFVPETGMYQAGSVAVTPKAEKVEEKVEPVVETVAEPAVEPVTETKPEPKPARKTLPQGADAQDKLERMKNIMG